MGNNNHFLRFVNTLRTQRGISMRQLCDGLCNTRVLSYVEKGQRRINYFLQRRLLERLGIDTWDFEIFVDRKEYDNICKRIQIIQYINEGNYSVSSRLLDEYEEKYGSKNNLCKQFYYAMKAQIAILMGNQDELVFEYLREGLELTFSSWGEYQFDEKVISMTEMNLLLEISRFESAEKRKEIYKRILEYIDGKDWDKGCLTKIYPKVVCLYCENDDNIDDDSLKYKLSLCNKAIELLRNTNRLYYLLNLLYFKKSFMGLMQENECESKWNLQKFKEINLWINSLERIYKRTNISWEKKNYTYVYIIHGVYCINDVIRKRRIMFGLSREKLVENICDLKTIGRLERGECLSQEYVLKSIARALNLPSEFIHLDITCGNPRLRDMIEQRRRAELRREISNEYCINEEMDIILIEEGEKQQQLLELKKAFLCFREDKVSKAEYRDWVINILEKTAPLNSILNAHEIYITETEVQCIHHLMCEIEDDDPMYNRYVELLNTYYESFICNGLYIINAPMFDMVMFNVSRQFAKRGESATADTLYKYILKNSMRIGRASVVSNILYEQWLGTETQAGKENELLEDAISIANCFKKTEEEKFYRNMAN